ncbi:MAG: hypothetical protein AB8G99_17175 [Planctomycetaceae bacterium]
MEIDVYKEWLGIPESERPPTLYALLRVVQFEDNEDKIRAHYKKLNEHVRKYASGQFSVRSQELLNELAKAMLCLTDPDRKREYDESLGREFADEEDSTGRRNVAQYLAKKKVIDRAQVKEVANFAEARGLTQRDAVVQMKLAEPGVATQAYAQELGMSFVDLNDMLPDDNVLDQVPRSLVKRHSILPLFKDDNVLLVACADEPDPELEDEMRLRFGMPMRPVLAVPLTINQAIAKYYAPGMRDEAGGTSAPAKSGSGKGKKKKPAGKKNAAKKKGGKADAADPQTKQLAIIGVCWAIIGAALIDVYLIGLSFPYGLTALVLPASLFAFWKFFLKS